MLRSHPKSPSFYAFCFFYFLHCPAQQQTYHEYFSKIQSLLEDFDYLHLYQTQYKSNESEARKSILKFMRLAHIENTEFYLLGAVIKNLSLSQAVQFIRALVEYNQVQQYIR